MSLLNHTRFYGKEKITTQLIYQYHEQFVMLIYGNW